MSYRKGHIRRNPETGEIAIRTMFPEDQGSTLAGLAWIISSADNGARHSKTPEIEEDGWEDFWVPEEPVYDLPDENPPVEVPVVEVVEEPPVEEPPVEEPPLYE
jgi:hypothetical protein